MRLELNQKVLVANGSGAQIVDIEAEIVNISSETRVLPTRGALTKVKLRVGAGVLGFEKLVETSSVLISVTSEQTVLDYIFNRLSAASDGQVWERLTGQ